MDKLLIEKIVEEKIKKMIEEGEIFQYSEPITIDNIKLDTLYTDGNLYFGVYEYHPTLDDLGVSYYERDDFFAELGISDESELDDIDFGYYKVFVYDDEANEESIDMIEWDMVKQSLKDLGVEINGHFSKV